VREERSKSVKPEIAGVPVSDPNGKNSVSTSAIAISGC
jgi:hypothetical protein